MQVGIEISLVNNPTTTWTATSNRWLYALGTRNIIDNIPRAIISVNAGGVELVKAGNFQLCDSIDGSFYWNWAGGTNGLYVNLAGTTNPNTKIVIARFHIGYSNFATGVDGEFYESRVVQSPDDVSVRTAVDSELMSTETIKGGEIAILNGSPDLDTYTIDDILKNYIVQGQNSNQEELLSGVSTTLKSGMVGAIKRTDSVVVLELWN